MGTLFSFSGRVGRSVYWLTAFAGVVLYGTFFAWQWSLAAWEQPQFTTNYYSGESQFYWEPSDGTRLIYILFAMAVILFGFIGLSVGVRRWHDLDKSGWWSLITLVPLVGGLYALAMLGFVSGSPGSNRYGPPAGARASLGTGATGSAHSIP